MKRREVLTKAILLAMAFPIMSCSRHRSMKEKMIAMMGDMRNIKIDNLSHMKTHNNFNSILSIPDIEPYTMENKHKKFNLNIQNGTRDFFDEDADVLTFGVNSEYLGSTLRVKSKDLVSLNVINSLWEQTSLHWHGLHVEGQNDGTMHQSILPNTNWNPKFMIDNQAGTYFYHAHTHNKTGEHVYKGIAGMIIIDDDVSENLDIPQEYGIDDIPLIIQDKYFTDARVMPYTNIIVTNTYMVNGVISPLFNAKKTLTKFRILNASNAKTMYLGFSDKRDFYQISTDGGLMEKSAKSNIIQVSPSGRVEILVDLSDKIDDLFLVNNEINFSDKIMKINAKNAKKSEHKIPTRLTKIKWIKEEEATTNRDMILYMKDTILTINNKKFLLSRIDEKIKLNSTEIWTIKNSSGSMAHPFHIHGTSFQVLSRNGKQPLKSERGWKDTVFVGSKDIVRIIMRFNHKADKHNPYMYHCHILEHEDMGMMGQFTVI